MQYTNLGAVIFIYRPIVKYLNTTEDDCALKMKIERSKFNNFAIQRNI